mmetsp:Transcript_46145/g.137938  ORF Transcript_46145/g.137938 Transcript_46145/m.137938 type:complete len:101 (+) Transcript_46145:1-303(+)
MRPDGQLCSVTRIIRGGRVVQEGEPHCEAPRSRRLQSIPWPFGESQPQQEVVEDGELWMLGGVFLEHFVTAFDFDHGRLGLGEPAGRRLSEESSGTPLYP